MSVEGWKTKALGSVAEIIMGQSPDSRYYSEEEIGLPFLQGCAEFTSKFPSAVLFCSQVKKIARTGSILFSVRAPVGRTNLTDTDYIIGRGLAALIASQISQDYLHHYLVYSESGFRNNSQGSTFEAINSKELRDWAISFPEFLQEQTQIATILSTIDRAIEQTEALIAKQQRIKTGLMQDLLTKGIDENGNIRSEETHEFKDSPLGRIPVEWEVVTTGQVTKSLVPGRDKPDLDGGGVPWITIPDIEGMYLDLPKSGLSLSLNAIKVANARLMPKGTVLMSCVGEFGIATITECDAVANQQLHGFICDQSILPEWLIAQINASGNRIDNMATQTTIKYLNKNGCESILITLPSLKEQVKIISILDNINDLFEKQKKSLNKLRSLKTGLMQDLLTGKVRVTELIKERETDNL
jgi:type I restriction enzyme S subunit